MYTTGTDRKRNMTLAAVSVVFLQTDTRNWKLIINLLGRSVDKRYLDPQAET